MSTQRRLGALLLVLGTFTTASARAQDADALIDEGVTLREQGRDAEARDRFERAYALSSTSHALAQLALAEQALGDWVKAYTHLTAALGSGGEWVTARRQPLEQALARIAEHVGHLELVGGVEGAEVRVNGEVAGALPLAEPLLVPAGTVVLEITATGYVPMRRTIEIRGGGRARERVVLVAAGAGAAEISHGAAASTAPAGNSGGGDLVSASIGAFAVAGAGAVVLAIFGGLAAAGHATLSEGCGATTSCTPSDVADTETYALVGDLGLGVAVAGAAVGAVLLIMGLTSGGSADERAAFTPWLTPTGGGAAARLRF